jgi:hypothetical protein
MDQEAYLDILDGHLERLQTKYSTAYESNLADPRADEKLKVVQSLAAFRETLTCYRDYYHSSDTELLKSLSYIATESFVGANGIGGQVTLAIKEGTIEALAQLDNL